LIPQRRWLMLALELHAVEGRRAVPRVECPNCLAKLEAPAEYKGRAVRCKSCGESFVLRFTGHNRPPIAGKFSDRPETTDKSTVSFRLTDAANPASSSPGKGSTAKRADRQPRPFKEKPGEPISVATEPWRAAIYQRVAAERFNGNFSAFARAALDTLAEQLGYPLKPP
jgi:hypothetical protein